MWKRKRFPPVPMFRCFNWKNKIKSRLFGCAITGECLRLKVWIVSNEEVIWQSMLLEMKWLVKFTGDILRCEGFISMVSEDSEKGKNGLGRPRLRDSKQIKEDIGFSSIVDQ